MGAADEALRKRRRSQRGRSRASGRHWALSLRFEPYRINIRFSSDLISYITTQSRHIGVRLGPAAPQYKCTCEGRRLRRDRHTQPTWLSLQSPVALRSCTACVSRPCPAVEDVVANHSRLAFVRLRPFLSRLRPVARPRLSACSRDPRPPSD